MPRNRRKKRGKELARARNAFEVVNHAERSESNQESPKSASAKKLKLMDSNTEAEAQHGSSQKWFVAHTTQLNKLLASLPCEQCGTKGLTFDLLEKGNAGFVAKMALTCSTCHQEATEMSSPRLLDSKKKNPPFELNTKMVMFSHEVGESLSTLKKFATVMGMPTMHLNAYQAHDKNLTKVEVDASVDGLARARSMVRQAHAELDPNLQTALDNGEQPIIDITVSFDGSWQKRGFTSLFGVGACIDVLTGLVVDYHVLSKYCHACKLAEARLSADDLADWKTEHAPHCSQNYLLSSKAMEQEAAKVLWGRSLESRFRYVQMLSDGDSTAYKSVCDLAPYSPLQVEKLECVNHAHKRMGTALRKLTKKEKLGGRGTGKLTEKKCDTLQNYYRGAILDNIPDVDKMRSAVWAGLFHSMSTDNRPQHQKCPEGKDSWCFYKRDIAEGKQPGSHAEHVSSTFLSVEVARVMVPVYKRMSDESLLRKMTHGGTQNTNESLNAMIWARCPKTSFMSFRRVHGSVGRAVAAYNEGAGEMTTVMNKLNLDISQETLRLIDESDSQRVAKAEAASSDAAKRQRRSKQTLRRNTVREEDSIDGVVYGAGIQ